MTTGNLPCELGRSIIALGIRKRTPVIAAVSVSVLSIPAGLLPEWKPASRVRLLRLIGKGIAGLRRRVRRLAVPAHTGGRGLACLHGRVATAVRRLGAIRNAIVVCVSNRRGDHEKRGREQRRCGEHLRSRFHVFFFLLLGVGTVPASASPERGIAPRFVTSQVTAKSGFATAAIRIAAIPNAVADL